MFCVLDYILEKTFEFPIYYKHSLLVICNFNFHQHQWDPFESSPQKHRCTCAYIVSMHGSMPGNPLQESPSVNVTIRSWSPLLSPKWWLFMTSLSLENRKKPLWAKSGYTRSVQGLLDFLPNNHVECTQYGMVHYHEGSRNHFSTTRNVSCGSVHVICDVPRENTPKWQKIQIVFFCKMGLIGTITLSDNLWKIKKIFWPLKMTANLSKLRVLDTMSRRISNWGNLLTS